MARNFVTASSQYLTNATTPITAVPMTLVGWFKMTSSVFGNILTVQKSTGTTSTDNAFAVRVTPSNTVRASTSANTAETTATFTNGTWNHAAAVIGAANSRIAYLNGANAVTETTNNNPAGIDCLRIGGSINTGAFNMMNGDLADVACWNVALTAGEIASLASGVSPCHIRPNSLKGYWPLHAVGSPEPDYTSGARTMTLNNTPVAATSHPWVTSPYAFFTQSPYVAAVAASLSIPVAINGYRRRRAA